ncbi:pheromone autoinducer 2 transporter [Anaerohalosphaera lusitana]|uniref:Pheromone autoinducer 2 transporter n=1 Tax=Anaerohalosphaera lusitana TaxID=1936003 RepID=A0A1U9NGU8_9BACT|nr:AI-2E family transporter [Anaerohalosphaera lusitana]AQT66978.1 pheromone autoinducer 2 transporter [Anaerohalosphaera lusitana]
MADQRNRSDACRFSGPNSTFTAIALFALLVLAVFFMWLLRGLLMPVFIALLLAYVFHPLISWLDKHWSWPAWLSVVALILLTAAIFAGFTVWLLPVAINQTSNFLQNLPDYTERVISPITEEFQLGDEVRNQIEKYSQDPKKLLPFIVKGTMRSLDVLGNFFASSTYVLMYITLMLVFFVIFSMHLGPFAQWFTQFLPASKRDEAMTALNKINDAAYAFLRTRLLVALILGSMFSIGWAIAGVPYWFLLGVISGLLSIIPYAAGIGWIAAVLLNVLEAQNGIAGAIVWPTVVYGVAQMLEGWLLTPYLQGEKLNIHPGVVLFAVLAGGTLAGLLGMLLAIPIVAAAQIIFTDHIKPRMLEWAKAN